MTSLLDQVTVDVQDLKTTDVSAFNRLSSAVKLIALCLIVNNMSVLFNIFTTRLGL